jgi:gliding motility-associated-like protein
MLSKRIAFLLLFLAWISNAGKAQHYVLDGLGVINCQPGIQVYSIDTDVELGETIWELFPLTGATILSSNLYSITIEFTSSGSYTLTCNSNSIIGMPFSDIFFIDVFTPIAYPEISGCYEFDPGDDCYKVCAHTTSTIFTDATEVLISGADEYKIFQDGLQITWGKSGIGNVILGGGPCEINLCFDILPEPTADFQTSPVSVADTITVCTYQQVFFENTSLNGTTYTWDFGDGDKSESQDAHHSYTDEGYYTVTLTAHSICECLDETSIIVHVLEEAAPQLDCINSICAGSRQRYTASTDGCSTFIWTVSANGTIVNGGGISDDFIEVIWHSGPEGVIELQVADCLSESCSSASVFRIPVITPDGPVEGDASVCSGETVTYTAPYFPGTTYQWTAGSFGEIVGERNLHQVVIQWGEVTSIRNTRVTVRYENCALGCEGLDVLNVSITPTMRLQGDVQVCEKSTATVSALAGFGSNAVPADVQWHIENEAGQILFTTPGTSSSWSYPFDVPPGVYTWVATHTSGLYCNTEARLEIQVTPLPSPPLGITGERIICPGQPYAYTIVESGVYATQWTITDGSEIHFYSGQSIEYTFGPTPPYQLEAVHQDIQFPSCQSSALSIDLTPALITDLIGTDRTCLYNVDRFTTPDIPGLFMEWEIIPAGYGEIKTFGENEIDVFWTQPGNATLRLTACNQVVEKSITIFDLPAVNAIHPPSLCENETTLVTSDQSLLTHRWVNASGQSIGTANGITLGPGTFGVSVTDANGCVDKDFFTIDSLPAPYVFISTPNALGYCNAVPAGVEVIANTPGGDYTYQWYLDNIPIGSGGPTLTVNTFGSYFVEVINQYGCRAISDDITFTDCCLNGTCGVILEGFMPGCTLLPYDFIFSTDETDCLTKTYSPDLTNIVPGSVTWHVFSASTGFLNMGMVDIYSYTFPAPGYYYLLVTGSVSGYPYDAAVCGHYARHIVKIEALADFSLTGICRGEEIQFEDLSTFLPDQSIVSWAWDFGDPGSGMSNFSNLQDPMHTYGSPGIYQITLSITMASGCTVTKQKTITIQPPPVMTVEYDALFCENEALAFILEEDLYNIVWNFDDPSSGPENTAQGNVVFHTYEIPGDYFVHARASDIFGCQSEAFLETDIFENNLSGIIAVSPGTKICYGDSAMLSAPPGGMQWEWSNGSVMSETFAHDAGLYDLILYNDLFCSYRPPPVFISVSPKPIVIIQAREILEPEVYGPWMSAVELCQGEAFELQVFSTSQVTYSWSHISDQQTLQFTDEGGNLPLAGEHIFTVLAFDPLTGCLSDSTSIHVLIHPLPVVPVISLTSGSGCSFNDNILTITNPEPGISYQWSDGQSGTSILVDKAGAYFVTAINAKGCMSLSNTLIIEAAAQVDQIPAGCIMACQPFEWCFPPLNDVESYSIYKDGELFASGSEWFSFIYLHEEGVYTIEVTTTNGCTATSDPLSLSLYTGIGSLTIETWLDTNGDMIISPGDQLLPGIPVQIESTDGLQYGTTATGSTGHFVFSDYPAIAYLASIDQLTLPGQYIILVDSILAEIETCDDSVVVQLLLGLNCTVTGPDIMASLCTGDTIVYGDSAWHQPGIYEIHLLSSGGCDSVVQVVITAPDSFNLTIEVWMDVDGNGVISAGDTLLPGIPVTIAPQPTGPITSVTTNEDGIFFQPLIVSGYLVQIDTALLPPGLEGIVFMSLLEDSLCGSHLVSFLLRNTCSPVFSILQSSVCDGDSLLFDDTWIHDAGQYDFIHTDPLTQCDTFIQLTLNLLPLPAVTGEVDWSCIDMGSIQIDVNGPLPVDIQWQGIIGDTVITGLQEGTYTVEVTDANGCRVTETFTIESSLPYGFELNDVYTLPYGDSILLEADGDVHVPGLTFMWQPASLFQCNSCPITWFTTNQDTIITLQITDNEGCTYLLNAAVHVFSQLEQHLYIPNTFSPNGDGINDWWTLFSQEENVWIEELLIFDRWGTMVFAVHEMALSNFGGWNGTFRGRLLNPGVFTYVGMIRSNTSEMVRVKGDVTLVR